MNRAVQLRDLMSLYPMHLHVDISGAIISAGITLKKIIGAAEHVSDIFLISSDLMDFIHRGSARMDFNAGSRVCFRLKRKHNISLRGQAIEVCGGALFDLGFGVDIVSAIQEFGLTAADFSQSDLAMEFLFLHEANSAIMDELSKSNTSLEAARRSAEILSVTDPLTGLLNRRGFDAALEEACRNAVASPIALVQLDLDSFKSVNDTFGHAAGDTVLCHVASAIRSVTRCSDKIARVGGDEFSILLIPIYSKADIKSYGKKILERILCPIFIDGYTLNITASLGVSFPNNRTSLNRGVLATNADQALYKAKSRGPGVIDFYD